MEYFRPQRKGVNMLKIFPPGAVFAYTRVLSIAEKFKIPASLRK